MTNNTWLDKLEKYAKGEYEKEHLVAELLEEIEKDQLFLPLLQNEILHCYSSRFYAICLLFDEL